jgi:hypothetical protein
MHRPTTDDTQNARTAASTRAACASWPASRPPSRRPRTPRRRGKAAVIVLGLLAALSLLIAAVGAIAAFRSGAGDSVAALVRQAQGIAEGAEEFDAPGSIAFDARKGGAVLVLIPDAKGRVADPKQGKAFTVTVTDADGGTLEADMNQSPPMGNGQGQAETLAFVEFPADGTFTIAVAPTDGTTTARIAILPTTRDDFDALRNFAVSAGVGTIGGCAGVCGLGLALCFGIAALVVGLRKPRPAAENDPLAF